MTSVPAKRCASPDHEGPNPLPLTEFNKNTAHLDGLASRCRTCDRAGQQRYRDEKRGGPAQLRTCRNCGGPLSARSLAGVCRRNPDCAKLRARLHKRGVSGGYLPCASCHGERDSPKKLCSACQETVFWCSGSAGTGTKHVAPLAIRVELARCRACLLLSTAQTRAKRKGIPFALTREYVESIWPDACPYLRMPLQHGVGKMCSTSPTLDRIEPAKGYVEGNVEVISSLANAMKNSATPAQLVTFAREVLRRSVLALGPIRARPSKGPGSCCDYGGRATLAGERAPLSLAPRPI